MKKTLLNSADLGELRKRFDGVSATSSRRWGKMNVSQMLCHVSDAFLVTMGEKPASGKSNLAGRTIVKWAALWVPRPWPHGVQTIPECDAERQGTPPAEFEQDKARAVALLIRFAAQPRDFTLQPHAIFGTMDEREWMRWGYLHTDHHLRQFGA